MRIISRVTFAATAVALAAVISNAVLHAEKPARTAIAAVAQELPDGPGKAEVKKLCDGCHDLTFTVSTRENEEGWTRIVNDMRGKGTDGSEEDFAKVIAYLTKYMGKQ